METELQAKSEDVGIVVAPWLENRILQHTHAHMYKYAFK